ncbi:hypothetical protein BDV96DRAFT_456494, partial [Lophiotrema nucula]
AHLRIARPTPSISALLPFYIDGLGFEILSSFKAHNGYDGVILGHPSLPYHLEFTTEEGMKAEEGRAPSKDNLLVFYIPDETEWGRACVRMDAVPLDDLGGEQVKARNSENSWWDGEAGTGPKGTKGRTFEDADGWRVVLF